MNYLDKEKRLSARKQSNYVIEFYDPDASFLMGVGRLIDLSATGALVESTLRLSTGQTLWARLRRGERANLELPVRVVRIQGKGSSLTYGLKFTRD